MPVIDPRYPITDPNLPPKERMKTLVAVGLGLSPMHPSDYAAIKAEYEECQRLSESTAEDF